MSSSKSFPRKCPYSHSGKSRLSAAAVPDSVRVEAMVALFHVTVLVPVVGLDFPPFHAVMPQKRSILEISKLREIVHRPVIRSCPCDASRELRSSHNAGLQSSSGWRGFLRRKNRSRFQFEDVRTKDTEKCGEGSRLS